MKTIIERGASWTLEETKMLLAMWGQDLVHRQATNTKRTKEVYEKISEKFNQNGYDRTADQVRTRVFNMIAEYRRILKDPSSERIKKCIFFEALHKIYQAKHMDDVKSALDDYEPEYPYSPVSNTISSERGDESVSDSEATDGNETINNSQPTATTNNVSAATSNNNSNNTINDNNNGDSNNNNNNNNEKESSSSSSSHSSGGGGGSGANSGSARGGGTGGVSKKIKLESPKSGHNSTNNQATATASTSSTSSSSNINTSSSSTSADHSSSNSKHSSKTQQVPLVATTLGSVSAGSSSSTSSSSQRHQSLLLPHATTASSSASAATTAASTPISKLTTSGSNNTPSYININSTKLPIIRTNQLIGHSNGNDSMNLNGTATRLPTTAAITSHQLYQAPVNTFDVTSSALLIDRMFAHLSRESENMREWIALEKERLALERARKQQETEREVRRERVLIDTLMRFQEQWLSFLSRLDPRILENTDEPPPDLKIPPKEPTNVDTSQSSSTQNSNATATTNTTTTNSTQQSNNNLNPPSEANKQ